MVRGLSKDIRIVFEDQDVVVVDKPVGLLTMSTDTERSKTLYALLRTYVNHKRPAEKLFIVHRLDREASGLLVFAKSTEAKEALQNQFKDHSAGRRYVAVVEGRVMPDEFTIRSSLAENSAFRVYTTRKPGGGKPAVTHVRVLKRHPGTSLVEVRLETGRKHQIRVHLAEQGHPIVGDKTYGSRANPLKRLALHGAYLEFRHPRTGNRVHFESAPPVAFGRIDSPGVGSVVPQRHNRIDSGGPPGRDVTGEKSDSSKKSHTQYKGKQIRGR